MKDEPSRLLAAITAALTATIGVLTLTEVLSEKLGGGLTVAAAAWIAVAGEWIRARVTPNDRVAALKPPEAN
jgi:hypothetical protein